RKLVNDWSIEFDLSIKDRSLELLELLNTSTADFRIGQREESEYGILLEMLAILLGPGTQMGLEGVISLDEVRVFEEFTIEIGAHMRLEMLQLIVCSLDWFLQIFEWYEMRQHFVSFSQQLSEG